MDKKEIEHVLFDYSRLSRTGLPEAVFCERKPADVLIKLMRAFASGDPPILFTRLWPDKFSLIPEDLREMYNYDPLSGTAFAATLPRKSGSGVGIVSAGSADAQVSYEAARTLEYLGIPYTLYEDCGVSGLWRLMEQLEQINRHIALIVIAGMEGALASVLGGLSPRPVFAVPTSVGYGVCNGGQAALNAMLASCAQGVAVLNIDNGFGAACAAARVVNLK